jgi:hypothetical protein
MFFDVGAGLYTSAMLAKQNACALRWLPLVASSL